MRKNYDDDDDDERENPVKRVLGGIILIALIAVIAFFTLKDTVSIVRILTGKSNASLASVAQSNVDKKILGRYQESIIGQAEKKLAANLSHTLTGREPVPEGTYNPVTLYQVKEGDKYIFQNDAGMQIPIKLIGTRAPSTELATYNYAQMSAEVVAVFLSRYDTVYIQYGKNGETADADGYIPAYVWFYDGGSPENDKDVENYTVNSKMLAGGMVNFASDGVNTEHDELFRSLSEKAEESGEGLWSDKEFSATWR